MTSRQKFISGVKGTFALSVIFYTRTSSALITARTEVSPSLHWALLSSWHGRPPLHGTAHSAECPMRTGGDHSLRFPVDNPLPSVILCFRKWTGVEMDPGGQSILKLSCG